MDLSFEEVYQTYASKIMKLCLGYCGDAHMAEDLHQETFINVWNNLPKFRQDSSVGTWIYRIAVNTCLLGLKKKKTNVADAHRILEGLVQEESQDRSQEIQRLYKCISKLKEHERIIITLVLEENTYEEIAAITGITESTLRVKIHRIKKDLQEIYNSYGSI